MISRLTVVFVGSEIEANYVASLLEENDIKCCTRNALYQSQIVGWIDNRTQSSSTDVYVYEEDTEKALKIIENYQHDKDQLSE